jgi:hypothetical protein
MRVRGVYQVFILGFLEYFLGGFLDGGLLGVINVKIVIKNFY